MIEKFCETRSSEDNIWRSWKYWHNEREWKIKVLFRFCFLFRKDFISTKGNKTHITKKRIMSKWLGLWENTFTI